MGKRRWLRWIMVPLGVLPARFSSQLYDGGLRIWREHDPWRVASQVPKPAGNLFDDVPDAPKSGVAASEKAPWDQDWSSKKGNVFDQFDAAKGPDFSAAGAPVNPSLDYSGLKPLSSG